jgi:hypothetical protein
MVKLTDKNTKMFKPHRQIQKEQKNSGEKAPWLIPDDERVIYGMEQQLEKGWSQINGERGAVNEAINGVLGATAKTMEVGVDVLYPLTEVANQTREAWKDVTQNAVGAVTERKAGEAIGYTAKGFGRILASPFIGVWKWPRRFVQAGYDAGRALEDLSGIKFRNDPEKGVGVGMHEKGLLRAGWSLTKGVGGVLKAPFTPFFNRKKSKSKPKPKEDGKNGDKPKEEEEELDLAA